MSANPGDLILFRITADSNWFEKLIGRAQQVMGQAPSRSSYNHVALVDAPGFTIIEAYWPRVRRRVFDPSVHSDVEIYRVKDITPEQVDRVLFYASQHIGEWYNVTAMLTLGFLQLGHTVVCSQFVWEAFTAIDISLCEYRSLITPDEIANSTLLTRVG